MNIVLKHIEIQKNRKIRVGDIVKLKPYEEMKKEYPFTAWSENFFEDNRNELFRIVQVEDYAYYCRNLITYKSHIVDIETVRLYIERK